MATDHRCSFFALQSMIVFDGPWSSLTPVTNLSNFLHQTKETPILFLSCHLPSVSASQLLAVLLSLFSARHVRCSCWPGCILAAGCCLACRRGDMVTARGLQVGFPICRSRSGSKWPCTAGLTMCAVAAVWSTTQVHLLPWDLVDCEWKGLGWQQVGGDAQWESLWALLRTKVTGPQWADLKGFKCRK